MIKLSHYVNPVNSIVWCIEMQYTDENNKPVFKAYYEPDTISIIQTDEWKEQQKENTGQNIACIYIQEMPDEEMQ